MKTENRKKEYTGLMDSLDSRTVRERDREREREREREKTQKTIFQKTLTQCVYICVFNEHVLYKSLED